MRLEDVQKFLADLGFTGKQVNERAARTLLALGHLNHASSPDQATNERYTVRALMDWFRQELNDQIAENSRETIRRVYLHQFVEAGLCLHNDDDPQRPVNSSKNNYRLSDEALNLLQLFGTVEYVPALEKYLVDLPGLSEKYKAEREMVKLPVVLPDGVEIKLSNGGQNLLIKQIVEEFCSRFIPNGQVLYVGDAGEKLVIFEEEKLASLGIPVETHGKMPDLIVYQEEKNWLFLMEAASTHGSVDNKRYAELQNLFGGSTAGLVLVSCFPNRETMRKFLVDLAWETEAWVASDPTHMIHLNGSRFMGPY